MKRILLAVAAVLVLLAVGATVAVLTGAVSIPFLGIKAHPRPKPATPPVTVSVPMITTNLSDPGGAHFAQVTMTLSLANAALAKSFNAKLAAVEDAVIADLRQSSSTQLAGAGGMTGLSKAVTASVDQVLGDQAAVRAVYFTQFVVQ